MEIEVTIKVDSEVKTFKLKVNITPGSFKDFLGGFINSSKRVGQVLIVCPIVDDKYISCRDIPVYIAPSFMKYGDFSATEFLEKRYKVSTKGGIHCKSK